MQIRPLRVFWLVLWMLGAVVMSLANGQAQGAELNLQCRLTLSSPLLEAASELKLCDEAAIATHLNDRAERFEKLMARSRGLTKELEVQVARGELSALACLAPQAQRVAVWLELARRSDHQAWDSLNEGALSALSSSVVRLKAALDNADGALLVASRCPIEGTSTPEREWREALAPGQ